MPRFLISVECGDKEPEKQISNRHLTMVIISLGSNLSSVWGTPQQTLGRALDEISKLGVDVIRLSQTYCTLPYGYTNQANFHNTVAIVGTALSADLLLRVFKQIEAISGRDRVIETISGRRELKLRKIKRWAPRPLDIDIVDYKRIVRNWKMNHPQKNLRVVLPHPEAHKRAFVMRPLADIAPFWHHPVLGLTAIELLKRPEVLRTGMILNGPDPIR